MAGTRSLRTLAVSQLTWPPETIASCYRRSRHQIPTAFRTAPSTGEGLLNHWTPITDKKNDTTTTPDSRLLTIETEFGKFLTVMSRSENSLGSVFKQLFDAQDDYGVKTRYAPIAVKGAHFSFIGHVTPTELTKKLTEVDRAGGFANRCLYVLVQRSKLLPGGGKKLDYSRFGVELTRAQQEARQAGEMRVSDSFWDIWNSIYRDLTSSRPGILGGITARAEVHVRRLAMIYALLDQTTLIGGDHLKAALEVWRYCKDSSTLHIRRQAGRRHSRYDPGCIEATARRDDAHRNFQGIVRQERACI